MGAGFWILDFRCWMLEGKTLWTTFFPASDSEFRSLCSDVAFPLLLTAFFLPVWRFFSIIHRQPSIDNPEDLGYVSF